MIRFQILSDPSTSAISISTQPTARPFVTGRLSIRDYKRPFRDYNQHLTLFEQFLQVWAEFQSACQKCTSILVYSHRVTHAASVCFMYTHALVLASALWPRTYVYQAKHSCLCILSYVKSDNQLLMLGAASAHFVGFGPFTFRLNMSTHRF